MPTTTSLTTITAQPDGRSVSTAITAGGHGQNHSEGVVVETSLKAGGVIIPQ